MKKELKIVSTFLLADFQAMTDTTEEEAMHLVKCIAKDVRIVENINDHEKLVEFIVTYSKVQLILKGLVGHDIEPQVLQYLKHLMLYEDEFKGEGYRIDMDIDGCFVVTNDTTTYTIHGINDIGLIVNTLLN